MYIQSASSRVVCQIKKSPLSNPSLYAAHPTFETGRLRREEGDSDLVAGLLLCGENEMGIEVSVSVSLKGIERTR